MTDPKKRRLNFQEACRELQISEEELEKLVARGEIASVKEGDTILFKPEVIQQFKKNRKTEPTIILSDDEMDLLNGVEELDIGELEVPAGEGAGKASGDDTDATVPDESPEEINLDDLEIPEISLEEEAPAAAGKSPAGKKPGAKEPAELAGEAADSLEEPQPIDLTEVPSEDTVLNLDGLLEEENGSESTTPVPGTAISGAHGVGADQASDDITLEGNLTDNTILDTDILDLGEEEEFKLEPTATGEEMGLDATASTLLRGGGARVMQMKRVKGHPTWTVILAVTALSLLVPMAVFFNLFFYDSKTGSQAVSSTANAPSPYQWIFDSTSWARGTVASIADLVAPTPGAKR